MAVRWSSARAPVGCRMSECRKSDVGCRMSDVEHRKSDIQFTNDKCMNATMRFLAVPAFAVLFELAAVSQTPQTLSVPADSPRWDLQQAAKVADYLGRKCLAIDGGAAVLKDFEMRDAVLDVDVATPAKRGFFGFDVRSTRTALIMKKSIFGSISPDFLTPCSTRQF